jgi:tetratricopeptide (TPR) repeat protein
MLNRPSMLVVQAAAAGLALLVTASGCGNSAGEKTNAQTQREKAQKHWAGARAGVMGSLAKEQYETGNFEKCRETIDEALKMDPDNVPIRVLSAKLAIEQGNLELADKELVQARRLDPKHAEADYLSGVVCQRWQRGAEAYEFYRSASEKQPSELAYLMAQAEMLVALNRSDEALALLQAKVVFFEHSATIRDAVGQLLMEKGKFQQAVEVLHQASILATDDQPVREHLALAHFKNKQYAEASEVLARLVKQEKYVQRADLHLALGECQLQMNKPRDARATFETASQHNPTHAPIWVGVGKASLQLNDLRRSEIALKRSLSIDPGSSEANLLLGYVRVRQDKYEEALGSFRKASALDPNDTVSLCMVGFVLEKLGRNDEALRIYAQALKLKPGDELATRLMADIHLDR